MSVRADVGLTERKLIVDICERFQKSNKALTRKELTDLVERVLPPKVFDTVRQEDGYLPFERCDKPGCNVIYPLGMNGHYCLAEDRNRLPYQIDHVRQDIRALTKALEGL